MPKAENRAFSRCYFFNYLQGTLEHCLLHMLRMFKAQQKKRIFQATNKQMNAASMAEPALSSEVHLRAIKYLEQRSSTCPSTIKVCWALIFLKEQPTARFHAIMVLLKLLYSNMSCKSYHFTNQGGRMKVILSNQQLNGWPSSQIEVARFIAASESCQAKGYHKLAESFSFRSIISGDVNEVYLIMYIKTCTNKHGRTGNFVNKHHFT